MSLDAFIFTPPDPEALGHTLERAQTAARTRFFQIHTGFDRPNSAEFAALARSLRDLTAMHRTLRKMAGPLFDPASPMRPAERLALFQRRLDRVHAVLGADDDDPNTAAESVPNSHAPGPEHFLPARIENLVDAVELATRVSADRFDNLDREDRPWVNHDEFLFEIQALRDITAVTRTLHRMAGLALPEDQSLDELQREDALAQAAPELSPAPSLAPDVAPDPAAPIPPQDSPSTPSTPSDPADASIPPDEPVASDENVSRLPQTSHFPLIRPLPFVQPFRPADPAPRRRPRPRANCSSPDRFFDAPLHPLDHLDDEPPYGNWTTPHAPGHIPVEDRVNLVYGPEPPLDPRAASPPNPDSQNSQLKPESPPRPRIQAPPLEVFRPDAPPGPLSDFVRNKLVTLNHDPPPDAPNSS